MPIEFHCSGCQTLLRVPDGSAGRQAKCPQCDRLLDIPGDRLLDIPADRLLDIPADSIAEPTARPTTNPFADPPPQTRDSQSPFQPPSSPAWQQAPADPAVMWKIARSRVAGPAIGMMVYASLVLVVMTAYAIFLAVVGLDELQMAQPPADAAERIGGIAVFVIIIVMYFAIYGTLLFGAVKMKRLESYPLAIIASILSMLPCCLLGMPLGIWSLVVLSDHNVKMMFGSSYQPPTNEPPDRLQV